MPNLEKKQFGRVQSSECVSPPPLTAEDFKYLDALDQTINIKPISDDRNHTVKLMFKKIIPCYHKGYCLDRERLILRSHGTYSQKEKDVLEIFATFLNRIKEENITDSKKIELIATTMRDIEQKHPFSDGNGRSVYILSNFLLYFYDLKMFYPENMCLFDANSKSKMTAEIQRGQNRFSEMFGDEQTLTVNLSKYSESLLDLSELISKKYSTKKLIQKSLAERNFNLLLRQSATFVEGLELLEFLLINAKALNIDISATGKTSGNAAEIAFKHNNEEALILLKKHIISNLKELIAAQKISIKLSDLMQASVDSENFDLLFRQGATIVGNTNILEFLLQNTKILNIDIHSSGRTSGNALDIALKNKNQNAIDLLKEILKPDL